MGSFVKLSETFHLRLANRRMTLYKRAGESYEHVLMKALGYAMFYHRYPNLEIERRVGLRYKPDLIALDETNQIKFWGECGSVSFRKIGWLAKHSGAARIVIFKYAQTAQTLAQWVRSLNEEVEARHRPTGRLSLINFIPAVTDLVDKEINEVPGDWYHTYEL